MEHQYPAPIGGDEHMLAELMLPDQAHVRSQDWTIFFLHKDVSDAESIRGRKAARRRARRAEKRNGLDDTAAGAADDDQQSTDQDDLDHTSVTDEDLDLEEDEAIESIQGPPLVYVLNLVNTKQDNTVKRGAVVKAMAICTRHSFLHIYKVTHGICSCFFLKSP